MRSIGVVVIAGLACSSSSSEPPERVSPSTPSAPVAATGPDDLGITLDEPGREPRRARRYTWSPGARDAFTLDWTFDGSSTSNMADKPQVRAIHLRLHVELAVPRTTPHVAEVALRVAALDIIDNHEPGLSDAEIAHLVDAQAMFTANDREWIVPAVVTGSLEVNQPERRPVGEMWTAAVHDLVGAMPSWPRGPIGVGARWHLSRQVTALASQLTEDVTFELVAVDDATATVHVTAKRLGEPQRVLDAHIPKAFSGGEVRSFTTEGSGDVKVAFDHPWPRAVVRDLATRRSFAYALAVPELGGANVTVTKSPPMIVDSVERVAIATAPSATPPEPMTPRVDGAYCRVEHDPQSLVCTRFFVDGNWAEAVADHETDPAKLRWHRNDVHPLRWATWGDRVALLWGDHDLLQLGTLARDRSTLVVTDARAKVEELAFVVVALPAPSP